MPTTLMEGGRYSPDGEGVRRAPTSRKADAKMAPNLRKPYGEKMRREALFA